MKNTKIYGLMLLAFGMVMTACSNLDESKAIITSTDNSTIYSETFATSLGQFKNKSVAGNQVWAENTSGYAMMTGYANSTNYANEAWLISPEIDMTTVTTAHLTFDHCARYFANVSAEATIWISENYVNDSLPTVATWTQIQTNPFSDPGSWTFNSSGQISLTAYAGKKVHIAFKYISSATKAGTWEVKNFLIQKGEAVASHSLIYAEPFAGTLGLFTSQSVSGIEAWVGNSSGYALMTGYVGSVNKADQTWLISPAIDLTNYTAANFSFDFVTRYFGTLATEATVWISTDYVSGLPSTGTWTQVVTNPFFDQGSYTFTNSQAISLTAYCGKQVHIAFKYISTTSKAGTWELKNFQVFSGEANGILALPYTVSQATGTQSSALGWVQGYVVGYAWPFQSQYAYFFTPDTCSQMVNVLLADTTFNLYVTKCLAVQLPRGGVRNGLNLKANKGVFGQKIKVYGTLAPNFGLAGMIQTQQYILPDGTTGTSTTQTLFSQTFASNLGTFTTKNVLGSQVWAWSSGYGATMTGFYSSTNVPNEDWLISPVIDLTSVPSAALTFDHTINKGLVANIRTEETLWISTDTGNTWKQLTIPTYPTGSNWTYVNSGEISLDAYAGNQIMIAFKYISTTASASTWEVKNFLVYY